MDMMEVRAARPIAAGDELTLTYISSEGSTRAERQSYLREQFGFTCACQLCTLAGAALRRSDDNQRRLCEINEQFGSAAHDEESLRALERMLLEREELLAIEGMPLTWGGEVDSDDDLYEEA